MVQAAVGPPPLWRPGRGGHGRTGGAPLPLSLGTLGLELGQAGWFLQLLGGCACCAGAGGWECLNWKEQLGLPGNTA